MNFILRRQVPVVHEISAPAALLPPQCCSLLSSLSPQILRFPSRSIADVYSAHQSPSFLFRLVKDPCGLMWTSPPCPQPKPSTNLKPARSSRRWMTLPQSDPPFPLFLLP